MIQGFPRLGKAPARPGAVKLELANYVDRRWLLSRVPKGDFGHDGLIGADAWGMLGNDSWGCCVWAGAAHETMLWNRIAGRSVAFTTANIAADYGAVTGFDPSKTDSKGNNPTDQGTDMVAAAKYRQKVGVVDAAGKRHQIAAYLSIAPGDLTEHWLALYLGAAVGVGIEVPTCFEDQFDAGKPWDISTAPGSMISIGGHYIALVGRRGGAPRIVTYGKDYELTPRAFNRVNDESIAYVSDEMLLGGKSVEGFDRAALIADLAKIALPATA